MTAAMWCADLGMSVALIDSEPEAGGQLRQIHNRVDNYPGLVAENGSELAGRFEDGLNSRQINRLQGVAAVSIDMEKLSVELDNRERIPGRSIVIATGLSRRRLDVPGEGEFHGKGMLESGVGQKNLAAGKRVVIVGGGDAAIENSVILSEVAANVTVLHRRNEFTARRDLLGRALDCPNIQINMNTEALRFEGGERLNAVVCRNNLTGETRSLPADLALIRIGFVPNSSLVSGQAELDAAGYIRVDRRCETSCPGLFAAGDVANPAAPTIVSAAGMGATAAKTIYSELKKHALNVQKFE